MATSDDQGPLPPNAPKMLPRLYKGKRLSFQRDHHLKGDIPTYWGPAQDAPDENGKYIPPSKWPRKGTALRVPRVARWFWEAANADYEVVLAMGPSATYSYGQHNLVYSIDISTPPGIIPVHIHETTLDQYGFPAYGAPFTVSGSGTLEVPDGTFSGAYKYDYWLYVAYLPPISMREYENRDSLTYKAVALLWQILEGGFVPPPAHQEPGPFGFPPMSVDTDGPTSVGVCYPVRTGIYWINGVEYGERKDPNTLGLTIPSGWAQPPTSPTTNQDAGSNWTELSDKLNKQYEGSTNPYFNAYPKTFGIDQFLDIVTPFDDGFFACHTVNFILLSQAHDIPDASDPRVKRIQEVYKHMATYVVVILIDTQNIADQAEAGAPSAQAFVDAVKGIANALNECGWYVEEVSYLEPDHVAELIDQYIKDHLEPELLDGPPDDRNPPNLQGTDNGLGDGGLAKTQGGGS